MSKQFAKSILLKIVKLTASTTTLCTGIITIVPNISLGESGSYKAQLTGICASSIFICTGLAGMITTFLYPIYTSSIIINGYAIGVITQVTAFCFYKTT